MPTKLQILERYFGYPSFREGQEELIDALLRGQDAAGIMPTGAGKSLCFQVPALLLSGITLVVSPLISLMKDQVTSLVQNGIRGAYLNSSLTWPQYRAALKNAKAGVYKIIYVAPERLLTEDFLDFAVHANISMVTIDEAHCVSQWGQDFRPSYLSIPEFLRALPRRPVVSAFTATATPKVREDILALLELRDPFVLLTGFDRTNLYFEVQKPKNKLDATLKILKEHPNKSGIIYCSTRKAVEEVSEELCRRGFRASPYHAGLPDRERHKNQDDFLYDRADIMVATNAFGMGIDKSNVSFVIHYNMPKDLESYYQEAGRAGRDGQEADCILLYGGQDVVTNRFLSSHAEENESLSPESRVVLQEQNKARLKAMTFYCHTSACLREYILHYFGETTKGYCGNCFNCNHLFREEDISGPASEIARCVYELRGRFGVKMVSDILRGSKNEKVLRMGFERLPSHGKLAGMKEGRLRDMVNFLVLEDYLLLSGGEYPILSPGERMPELLESPAPLLMKLPEELPERASEKKTSPSRSIQASGDPDLLERLRTLRGRLAASQNVPAYVVFTNSALEDMCQKQPENPSEFLQVSGVGQAKLERYGKAFLEEIRQWKTGKTD